jgi:hypothetical protein
LETQRGSCCSQAGELFERHTHDPEDMHCKNEETARIITTEDPEIRKENYFVNAERSAQNRESAGFVIAKDAEKRREKLFRETR